MSVSSPLPPAAQPPSATSSRPTPPTSAHRILSPPTTFRRSSVPSVPSTHRISTSSIRSFDSLPEDSPASFEFPRSASPGPPPTGPSGTLRPALGQRAVRRSLTSAGREAGMSPALRKERAEKRWRAALELLETEQSYVRDLEGIWEYFLSPLLAAHNPDSSTTSLTTSSDAPFPPRLPAPLLPRKTIDALFPHFLDILQTNRELLRSLQTHLSPCLPPSPEAQRARDTLTLAPTFLALFPFLKLYTPFVRSFQTSQPALHALALSNPAFGSFVRAAEKAAAESGGGAEWERLGLGAKLLGIVQRVPRYRLMIEQILKYTEEGGKEWEGLRKAVGIVSDVANSINTHVAQHAQTLALLTLQRSFSGLTAPLLVPGRTHVRAGWLTKVCRKRDEPRAFFLFNDCLMYGSSSSATSYVGGLASAVGDTISPQATSPVPPARPTSLPNSSSSSTNATPSSGPRHRHTPSLPFPSASRGNAIDIAAPGQSYQFHRKLDLEDITVVGVDDELGGARQGRSFQVISSEKSFAVYTESTEERDEWLDAIRGAKNDLLSALRTLKTSDAPPPHPSLPDDGTRRLRRRSLQAIAQAAVPLAAVRGRTLSGVDISAARGAAGVGVEMLRTPEKAERKMRVVEHYAAPVWVPDKKANACMSCAEVFGMWRRKHHCRMCGAVVCHWCSTRTFDITNDDGGEPRPARACDTCYEAVFPPESPTLLPTSTLSSDPPSSCSSAAEVRPRDPPLTRAPSLTRSSYCTSTSSLSIASTPGSPAFPFPEMPPLPPPTPSSSSADSHPSLPMSNDEANRVVANLVASTSPPDLATVLLDSGITTTRAHGHVLTAPRVTTPRASPAAEGEENEKRFSLAMGEELERLVGGRGAQAEKSS